LLQRNGKFAFLLWFCCEEGDGRRWRQQCRHLPLWWQILFFLRACLWCSSLELALQ
jgi:hypothetical protein